MAGSWGRVGAVVAAVVGLVAGAGTGWAVESGWRPADLVGSGCPAGAAHAAVAAEIARRCQVDVEIVDERSEYDTVFAQPDGTTRVDSSIAAVRTKISGQWADVDPSLIRRGARIEVASPAVAMVFSDGRPDVPLARVERDGSWLTIDVPFDLPTPQITSKSQLTYVDVLPGVDLVLSIDDDTTGFSQALRVDSPRAAANPALAGLDFEVGVSSDLAVAAANGGFEAVTSGGKRVFSSPRPTMWDSALPPADTVSVDAAALRASEQPQGKDGVGHDPRAAGPRGGERVLAMPESVRGRVINLVPNASMLADPDTVWPVYIDPSVSANRNEWISVRDDGWSDYGYTGDQGVGHCGSTVSPMNCSKIFTRRALWEFGGPNVSLIAGMEPADVVSATFRVYGVHSYSCTAYPVELWHTDSISSSTSWPGTWVVLQESQYLAHKAACSNARWVEFDATAAAKRAAQYDQTSISLGLRAGSETSSTGWKRYRYDATLSVTYNRHPDTPTQAAAVVGSGTVACGGTPYLHTKTPAFQARIFDPDMPGGDQASAVFEVWSGAQRLWQKTMGPFSAAQVVTSTNVTSGLLGDATYQWRVYAKDTAGLLSATVSCNFAIDTIPPGSPTLTAVTGGEAVYYSVATKGGAYGGAGQSGRFSVAGGGSDVVTYHYSFDDDSLDSTATGTNPVFSWTPQSGGLHRLFATAEDAAGNVGPMAEFVFEVDFAGLNGAWDLDDGPGNTQATDISPSGQHPMVLSQAAWTPGPLGQRPGLPTDYALGFTGNPAGSKSAGTANPVVSTNESFTVMATVRLDDATPVATAVSQDDQVTSGFELGYRQGACPGGASGCWSFSRPLADSATSELVSVLSAVPATTGSWVHLTGIYDASGHTMTLYTCALEPGGGQVPVEAASVSYGPSEVPNADLGLIVGRGKVAGNPEHGWTGAVADVHVYDGVVDQATVRSACQSPR